MSRTPLCRICRNEVGYLNGDVCVACNDVRGAYGEPEEQEPDRMPNHIYSLGDDGPETHPGFLVETKSGKVGRTYHADPMVNGKQVVHVSGGKMLCDPATLKLRGFID